ncbi:hypothetical protein COL32_14435 [Bacillus pseudomycoides]|uniref:hypothetical protein n=1 Tax=Bacillus pseudomycoides TaxID=64104 RepID=UPI000BF5489E|nr:hypothetical protein [Bacillus pseudomycoides]PFX43526.1 hypothetical protein COL32_14435 [Bacillus pseudomycoides]
MANKKEEIKKEIYRNLRSIAILIIVITLIYFDISLAKQFNFTKDPKIIWAFDFGIYSSLISILFSIIYYFFKGRQLHIELNILNKKEDTNEITLRENPEKIHLKLHIEGKYKKVSSTVKIFFPDWIDVQTKPKPYLSFDEDKNTCFIDLECLILNKENVFLTKYITFYILNNEEEKNLVDLVEAKLDLNFFVKYFMVNLENKGIKIKNK